MPNRFEKLVTQLGLTRDRLQSPEMVAEADEQDTRPENMEALDAAMARQRHPVQQQALMNEKQRIQQVQLQQVQQASQQFAPRLQQSLDLESHLGMPAEGNAAKLAKLMLMMRGMKFNNQAMPNAAPAGGPYNPIFGVRG